MARSKARRHRKPEKRQWGFWVGQGRQVETRDGDSIPRKDATRQNGYWVAKDWHEGERDRGKSW
jgi:hypothetical protein